MEPNSYLEYQQMASLLHDSGYILLMDNLKAKVDDVAVALDLAKPHEERQLLARWRALREVYTILSTVPQNAAAEIDTFKTHEEETKGPQMPARFVPQKTLQSQEEIAALKKRYEELTGLKVAVL